MQLIRLIREPQSSATGMEAAKPLLLIYYH